MRRPSRIEHLLPGRPGTVGRNSELGNRPFVEAVIWKFRVATRGAICQDVLASGATPTSVLPLGRERRLGESFQDLGERSRQ